MRTNARWERTRAARPPEHFCHLDNGVEVTRIAQVDHARRREPVLDLFLRSHVGNVQGLRQD